MNKREQKCAWSSTENKNTKNDDTWRELIVFSDKLTSLTESPAKRAWETEETGFKNQEKVKGEGAAL